MPVAFDEPPKVTSRVRRSRSVEPSVVEVGVGEHRDEVDRDPRIPQRQPRRDVRLVTGFGHQHPIARLPQARQRPADGEEVGGGVSPQAHLVGGCADQLRGRLVGLRSQLEGVLLPGEDFSLIGEAGARVSGHRRDCPLGHLRTGGVVEMDQIAGEAGELAAPLGEEGGEGHLRADR